MKILHLSDTTLSGAPDRLCKAYSKYSGHEARHLVWQPVIFNRVFEFDVDSSKLNRDEIVEWLDWADVIHYHNRYGRQKIFEKHDLEPPKKPSVIQIHSPRESENFVEEVRSGVPIAVIAQFHTRQWPEKTFIVPNVVDIYDPSHMPVERPVRTLPIISYSPSNAVCKGWDDKSYSIVSPILRRMLVNREVLYHRIFNMPHTECLKMKQISDIGVDEISTGSYHMSSLEYLSMGVACFGKIDEHCEKTIKDLTGADWLPWVMSKPSSFKSDMVTCVRTRSYIEHGKKAREWMEKYWDPYDICDFFTSLYKSL